MPFFFGGDDRDRTDYLLNAIQALSQVSYAPKHGDPSETRTPDTLIKSQVLCQLS